MRGVATLIVILTVVIPAAAQNSLRLKLFHNTDYIEESTSTPFGDQTRERVWNFQRVSFAAEFGKQEKIKHQLELFFPQVERPTNVPGYPLNYGYYVGPFKTESTAFAFRYEALRKVAGKSDRVNLIVGLGLNPYYQKTKNISLTQNYVDRSHEKFGAVVNVIGAIEVALTKRFFIEASVPLKLYDFRSRRQWINNPALPFELQKNKGHEHVFFETAYTLRLGLIYDFR